VKAAREAEKKRLPTPLDSVFLLFKARRLRWEGHKSSEIVEVISTRLQCGPQSGRRQHAPGKISRDVDLSAIIARLS
jgi:hypothetical protein